MAHPDPTIYLSLLSGRQGDVSDLSDHVKNPFYEDPGRLFHVLDALAAICVHKDKGDVFFVSLAMDSTDATLYVSTNGTVPPPVIAHLHAIQKQLKELRDVLEFTSPPSTDIDSPDPNITESWGAGELNLQRIIYGHSYRKLRQCYQKRGPEILAQYDAMTEILRGKYNIGYYDNLLLDKTKISLQIIGENLTRAPQEPFFTILIKTIASLSKGWMKNLDDMEENGLLSRWDSSTSVKKNRHLSLRRCLQKIFTLHHHIQAILRIAWSKRLSPFLQGLKIISVPAVLGNISIDLSLANVLPIAFPEDEVSDDKRRMHSELVRRLQAKAKKEGIEMKSKNRLKLDSIYVHAESSLLAYHIQHPEINTYQYFGGSKLSCHACGILFRSYNSVADSLNLTPFFTKGCHDKIYLRWPYPSLQSNTPSLNIKVREAMIKALDIELAEYIGELREKVVKTTAPQSDSTSELRPGELENQLQLLSEIDDMIQFGLDALSKQL